MSTTLPHPPHVEARTNYLNADYGWKSWLFTTDHKRIALLYVFSITIFFALGGCFAVGMRLNLLSPTGLFAHDTYNKLFTMHGIIMVFFFLVPSIPATLGNFLVPIMVGARDLAFPRINLLSWYIYVVAGIVAIAAVAKGGVDTGWTFYAPFSSTYSNTHVILAALAVFISGFSSILTGLNFIVTIHKMRAPGMTLVEASPVRMGPLCHQSDPGSWHAGSGDHHRPAGPRAYSARRHFRSEPGWRSGSCSSTCSGSTRTPPCTS